MAAPIAGNIEAGFFASLGRVIREYELKEIDVTGKPYPYNVLLAHEQAQQQLRATGRDISLTIQQEDGGSTCLVTTEVLYTGSTLYYLPIVPLYRLLQDRKQKRTAELLLSVCSYLYRYAGIPYYRNDYEYINNHYSYMEDWYSDVRESEGDEYAQGYLSELVAAKHYGDVMQRKLHSHYHLAHFAERIARYAPQNDYGQEALRAAKQAYALFQDYPDENIFRYTEFNDPDIYDDEVIQARQYISFVAETEGALYSQIEQSINEEFGNFGSTEMPSLTKYFDSNYMPEEATLDFEHRVFALLDTICFLLNNTP